MTSSDVKQERALVIGGGMGGLLAARVLADHFKSVVLIEQDDLAADAPYRRGTPQARHPHALVARGAEVLERLFPGLRSELVEQGAQVADAGEQGVHLLPTGWAPKRKMGVNIQAVTRSTLERHVRQRVASLPQVEVKSSWKVEDLAWDPRGKRVVGVWARPTGAAARHYKGMPALVQFDSSLVVCATGRASLLATWLERAGFQAPRALSVAGRVTYSTCLIKRGTAAGGAPHLSTQLTFAPWVRRGGIVMTVEGGQQLVTLLGADGQLPPNDSEGFDAYAESLQHPGIAEALAAAVSRGPVYRMVNINSQWMLYHLMPSWPDGLVAIGDAVCILNPIYGHGMTVTALEAEALGKLLSQRRKGGDRTGLARDFQRRAARTIRVPWVMATSADRRWTTDRHSLTTKLAGWYTGQVLALIPGDPRLYRRFHQVSQLIRSPLTLLHPSVLWAVACSIASRALFTGRSDEPCGSQRTPSPIKAPRDESSSAE